MRALARVAAATAIAAAAFTAAAPAAVAAPAHDDPVLYTDDPWGEDWSCFQYIEHWTCLPGGYWYA